MRIKYTLDCFKDEFKKNILSNLGYENYFEYLNSETKHPEYFILEITSDDSKSSKTLNLTEEDLINEYNEKKDPSPKKKVAFANANNSPKFKLIDNENIIDIDSDDSEIDNSIVSHSGSTSSISIDEDEEEEMSQIITEDLIESVKQPKKQQNKQQNPHYQFKYKKTYSNIFVECSNSKEVSKNLKKNIRKKGGKWSNEKQGWIFPLSAYAYIVHNLSATEVENKKTNERKAKTKPKHKEQDNESHIEKFYENSNKIYIVPKKDHPNYGKTIVYDKKRNMGIWDVVNKAWVFDKKN
jgi:hypothetical protein